MKITHQVSGLGETTNSSKLIIELEVPANTNVIDPQLLESKILQFLAEDSQLVVSKPAPEAEHLQSLKAQEVKWDTRY